MRSIEVVTAPPTAWRALSPEQALEPYDPQAGHGPWNAALAAHLLRRAVGGPRPGQAATAAAEDGPAPLLARLFTAPDEAAAARAARRGAVLAQGERAAWAAGWLMDLVGEDRAPGQRLSLFWHGHFACALSKVRLLPWMEGQRRTFLRHGEGDFGALAQAMLRDPALLRFLDGDANRRGLPNENLARELLELFTLGIGPYDEQDVQEGARALTGRTVRRGAYHFERLHHDREPKTVLGRVLDDGDELAAVAVAHEACPRFLVRSLWRFYVAPDLDPEVESLLATRWRAAGLDVTWLLRTMLASRAFFAPESQQALVASPVDLAVGTMRALGAKPHFEALERAVAAMGQELGEPPGVQGWAGGEAWIHTASWLERTRFAEDVSRGRHDFTRGVDDGALVPAAARRDAGRLLDAVLAALLPAGLEPSRRDSLARQLASAAEGEGRLQQAVYAVLSLPEYHLF